MEKEAADMDFVAMVQPILLSPSNYRSGKQMARTPQEGVGAVADTEPPVLPVVDSVVHPRLPNPPFDQRLPQELAD